MTRVTKQDEIDSLKLYCDRLEEDNAKLGEQLRGAQGKEFPHFWWIADKSIGQPLCFGDSDGGVALEIYHDKFGSVMGARITEYTEVVGGGGLVPFGVDT